MLKAFIDDCKEPWFFKDKTGVRLCIAESSILRSLEEALRFLSTSPKQDEIYLDYVLSHNTTGLQVLNWLQNNPEKMPKEINLISSDPEGNAEMAKICHEWKVLGKIKAYHIHGFPNRKI